MDFDEVPQEVDELESAMRKCITDAEAKGMTNGMVMSTIGLIMCWYASNMCRVNPSDAKAFLSAFYGSMTTQTWKMAQAFIDEDNQERKKRKIN